MTRRHLAPLFGLALCLASVPAPAGEKGADERPLVDRVEVRLPAGRFAAFRWDPSRQGFTVEHLPPPPADPSPRAKAVVAKVPAWLREPLRRRLRRLPLVPIRVEGGPREMETRDANGDGLEDLVRVNEEGYVVYRRNRGLPGMGPSVLAFRRKPMRYCGKAGMACRPGMWGRDLWVGDLDGGILPARPIIAPGPVWSATGLFGFSAPAFGDLDDDGRPDLITGAEAGDFHRRRGAKDAGLLVVPGISAGSFSVPCLADLDGDGDLDLLSGNREGKVLLFRNVGNAEVARFTADTSDGALAALDVGDSSAPAAADVDGDGDVDLVVGNQKGELSLYLGPDWKKDEAAFPGLDVGEFASPCLTSIPRDGKETPCLLVGRLAGDVLLYEIRVEEGRARFLERDSWSFSPTGGVKDIEAYYEKSYFPEEEEALVPDDAATTEAYLSLLESAPEDLLDEVAFVVAHTPVEVLRAMARLGQAGLLLSNARAVYRMADRVAYARIVEKEDHTTLAYATPEGDFVEAPRDVYYWWVVHPRILYEIPCRVDASWWDVTAEQRGIGDSEWWKHRPEKDIHEPSEKGRFWRHSLATDERFGRSLFDSVASSKDLGEALLETHRFLARDSGGVGLMRFGYETQDVQPWQIYAKYYGSCGEHSIIGAACARTMLIPASVITDRGEDHQWNEWWGVDGRWHHWDCCYKDGVDTPWRSTEGREHKGKTVSSITRWRGDDRLDETTTTVFNDEAWGYTKRGGGYTDVAEVEVVVRDPAGRPVDGALVVVRSHWDNRNMVAVWGYTDGAGSVAFHLGFEPNGGYTIEALTPLGAAGVSSYTVEENRTYRLVLTTPEEKPAFTVLDRVRTSGDDLGEPSDRVTARLIRSEISPPNLVTGQRFRIASYITKEHGYRGTRGQAIPVDPGGLPEVLVFSGEEYSRFVAGDSCEAIRRTALSETGRLLWEALKDREHVVVISNLRSLWVGIEVEVSSVGAPVEDRKPPEMQVDVKEDPSREVDRFREGDRFRILRGAKLILTGRARDDVGVTELLLRCSGWTEAVDFSAAMDAETGAFEIEFDSGAGGPLPPGIYRVYVEARDAAGNAVVTPLSVEVIPSRSFPGQVIRQDDPDDPLKKCSWIYGPFVLDENERFFLAEAKSADEGFDMDMHLYYDRNGNGRIDGAGERIAQSTSPGANERIYRDFPKAGTYWLYCQGFRVEEESARLDVEVYPPGRHRWIVALSPVGRVREHPAEISARFSPPAAAAPGSVKVSLDGEDVTGRCEIAVDRVGLALPEGMEPNVPHTVRVEIEAGSDPRPIREWTFVIDTLPPRLDLLEPAQGSEVEGKTELEVRAADEGGRVTVHYRLAGNKELPLERDKDRPEIFRLTLDTFPWAPGEHFVWLLARDAAGNETERVLRLRR